MRRRRLTAPVLSHHRTYGSVYGGSCHVLPSEPQYLSVFLIGTPSFTLRIPSATSSFRPSCEAFAPDRNRKSVRLTNDKFSPSSEKISFRPLWPLLTSACLARHLTTTVALRLTCRSPRVMRTHLPAYARHIYVHAFRIEFGL